MSRDLEVRHCRVLLAVQDHGGIGAAARALGLAQSTVSETLLSLERLLGAPVTLRRTGREAVLTPAAKALIANARALVSLSEAALASGTQQSQASIRLGTVESISSFLLPGPLSEFRLLWPYADVRIAIGLCEELRRRVKESELDAAMTIESASRPRDPNLCEDHWPARLRLIAAPNHPLAGQIVGRRDLEARICLLTDHDGAFTDLVKSWVGNTARPPRLESAGSIDGVKRGVQRTHAIGILPDYAAAEEVAAQTLVALDTEDPLPPLSLCLTVLKVPPAGSPLDSLIGKIRTALGGQIQIRES